MIVVWWQPFLADILKWYLVVMTIGWLTWPLAWRVQNRLPDAGLGFSRIIGLALTALIAAWLSWIGFNEWLGLRSEANFYFALLVPSLASALTLRGGWRECMNFLRQNYKKAVGIEVGFLAAFFAFLLFRSWCADATWDVSFYAAEKWGNMAILQTMTAYPQIQPSDPWLAGYGLNYYYFSHWVWTMLARLSGVRAGVAFNLALATGFALLTTQAWSLGRCLARRRSGGFWALLLIAFAGPPATLAHIRGNMPNLNLPVMAQRVKELFNVGSRADGLFPYFWGPSDVIPHTRNEFPAFNWALGDLHAHAFGLLLLMAAVALLLQIFRRREEEAGGWYHLLLPMRMTWAVMLGLMAAMWATNGWDIAVLGIVAVGWVAVDALRCIRFIDRFNDGLGGWLLWAMLALLATGVVASFYTSQTYMPLQVRHEALSRLPGALSAFASVGYVPPLQRTLPSQWWSFWGFFATGGIIVLIYHGYYKFKALAVQDKQAEMTRLTLAIMLVVALLFIWTFHGWNRSGAMFEPLAVAILFLMAYLLYSTATGRIGLGVRAPLVFIATALSLQLLVEFVFIDDIIGPSPGQPYEPIQRYNTVFKLYYPAWILFALGLSGLLARLPIFAPQTVEVASPEPDAKAARPVNNPFLEGESRRRVWTPTMVLAPFAAALIFASGLYTPFAVAERYARGRARVEELNNEGVPVQNIIASARTLDALAFMQMPRYAPNDYRLGKWIRENLMGGYAYIVEGSSASYSMAGRFTVLTGMPNLLSWEQHEMQWRGSTYNVIWRSRRNWINNVYGADQQEAAIALESLALSTSSNIKIVPDLYIIWGSLERRQFGPPTDAIRALTVELKTIDGTTVFRYRVPELEMNGQDVR